MADMGLNGGGGGECKEFVHPEYGDPGDGATTKNLHGTLKRGTFGALGPLSSIKRMSAAQETAFYFAELEKSEIGKTIGTKKDLYPGAMFCGWIYEPPERIQKKLME
ncbi:hypothetical protein RUM44_003286 [Polyplax serrata]|uniref:Uncharacterized protein n=1 Tax=Polyplax serrata TaxID=468196 RepID=A0ABR1AG05_POLSC